MRKGYYHGENKIPVIKGEDGDFIGFGLGADYCAEHEWGVQKFKDEFGCVSDPLVFGLPRRQAKAGAKGCTKLFYIEFTEKKVKQAILVYNRWREMDERGIESLKKTSELRLNTWFSPRDKAEGKDKEPQVSGAWSDSDWGIRVSGKENIANLKRLYEAGQKGDICFFMGGGMAAFDNPGLCVAIASAIPESVRKMWFDADEDHHKLKEFAKATGIEELLTKAGKRWYALSPRWANEEKTAVKFWLNPCEQDKYNAAWLTVEELAQWAEERGPVVKVKVAP